MVRAQSVSMKTQIHFPSTQVKAKHTRARKVDIEGSLGLVGQVMCWISELKIQQETLSQKIRYIDTLVTGHKKIILNWAGISVLANFQIAVHCYEGLCGRKDINGLTQHWTLHTMIMTLNEWCAIVALLFTGVTKQSLDCIWGLLPQREPGTVNMIITHS